jgi:hypothetical protein
MRFQQASLLEGAWPTTAPLSGSAWGGRPTAGRACIRLVANFSQEEKAVIASMGIMFRGLRDCVARDADVRRVQPCQLLVTSMN